MTELILVRHGESIRNKSTDRARHGDAAVLDEQLKDDTDEQSWPLTEYGLSQAHTAGKWVRDHISPIEIGFVSPFLRARQTAEGLGLGLDWHADERLREREWGEYPVNEYTSDQYIKDLTHCSEYNWRSGYPGGESVSDLVPSAESFVSDVLTKYEGHRIAVVTHGGTLGALQVAIEGLSADQYAHLKERRLSNCCVIHYRFGKEGGSVRFIRPCADEYCDSSWKPLEGRP